MNRRFLTVSSAVCALSMAVLAAEPAFAQRGGGRGGDRGGNRGSARQGGGGGGQRGGGGGPRQGGRSNAGSVRVQSGGQGRSNAGRANPNAGRPATSTPSAVARQPRVRVESPAKTDVNRTPSNSVTQPRTSPQNARVTPTPSTRDVQRDINRQIERNITRDSNRDGNRDGNRWSQPNRNRDWNDRNYSQNWNNRNWNQLNNRNSWTRSWTNNYPWYSNYYGRGYNNYGGWFGNSFSRPYTYYGNYYGSPLGYGYGYGSGLSSLIGLATGLGGFGLPGIGLGYGGYGYGGYGYGGYGPFSNYSGYARGSTPYIVDNSTTNENYVATTAPNEDYLTAGRDAFLGGDYAESQKLANHAVIDQPDNAKAHELMMLSLFAQGEYQGATAAAHAVADLGQLPDWPTLYGYYKDRDKYVQQLKKLEQFVREHPDAPEGRFLLGVNYQMIGDNEPAQQQFAQYAKLVNGEDPIATKLFADLGGDVNALPKPPQVPVNAPNPANEDGVN